jgi:hypothetical protein
MALVARVRNERESRTRARKLWGIISRRTASGQLK